MTIRVAAEGAAYLVDDSFTPPRVVGIRQADGTESYFPFVPSLPSAPGAAGAWAPVVTFETPGDLSVAYASQLGQYSRVGNLVFIAGYIQFTPTHTTAVGEMRITGLPYSVAAVGATLPCESHLTGLSFPASTTNLGFCPRAGGTQAEISATGAGVARVVLSVANLPTGTAKRLYFSGVYLAA